MSGGGGQSTTTTQQGPPQQFLNAYSNINNQAQNVASQPLQQYQGNIVAGLSPEQQGGITGIQNAQGAANPFINAAAQEIGNSTTPLEPQIAPYVGEANTLYNQAAGTNLVGLAQPGVSQAEGLFSAIPGQAAQNIGAAQNEFGSMPGTAANAVGASNQLYGSLPGIAGQAVGQTNSLYGSMPGLASGYTGAAGGLYGAMPGTSGASTGAANQSFGSMTPTAMGSAGIAGGLYGASAKQLQPTQFSAGQVGQYESPYTQQVVGATQAEFNNQNAQQAAALSGNAISNGAFGGDRSGVTQGIAAGQEQLAQAPVIAGLENQGYAQALQEFNQQQQVGLGAQQATQQLEQGAGAGILAGGQQLLGAEQGQGQGYLASGAQQLGALQGAGAGILSAGQEQLGAQQAAGAGILAGAQTQLGANQAAGAGFLAGGQEQLGAQQAAGQGFLGAGQENISALQAAGQGMLGASGQLVGAAQGQGQLELGAAQGQSGLANTQLGAAQAQNWLASQAGFGMANLGNEALNTQLTGANALMGAGGLEQQVAQEQLNVPYEQFIQQQAYPFQTTGFQANIAEGLGGASGGNSSTSVPGPNPISQAAGLGLAGAGIYNMIGNTGAGAGAGGFLDQTSSFVARGGAIPHRDMGGGVPVPTGVPDMSMSIVPGAHGMGVPPSHPGSFNLNTNTGTTSTTKGGDSTFGSLLKGAGTIAAGVYGGPGGALAANALGSQVHFDRGGGIMAFPMHKARMPGTGAGIASNNNFMPHISAPKLAVGGVNIPQLPTSGGGGIVGGNGVSIPQLSTGPHGGGGLNAVNAYLNANKGGQPHPAAAPPAAAPPAAAPRPAAAPPGTTGNAPPGTQFGINGVLPATPSDAWLAYQQSNPNFNVGYGGGGGGGNARGGVVGRDVGGAMPDDQEVGPGIPGSTYDPITQEWKPAMPSHDRQPLNDPLAGMPMTPPRPGAMGPSVSAAPGGGGGGTGRPTGPPPPPPPHGIMASNLPPPPSTASDMTQGAGIVPAPAGQQQPPWDMAPEPSGQQQGQQPPPGHDRSHVGETLLAMGLGMMGGSSPFAGVNIGRGGEQGLQFGEQMRLREEQSDIRKMQVQELANYRNQMMQGRSDQLSERTQAAAAQQDIERQKLALQGKQVDQGKYTWSSGMGPDPNDPSKQVSGMYRLPTTGTEQPQFIAGQTLTAKSQSAASSALPPDVTKMLAQQALAGDASGQTGLGYGTAGAQARIAVKTEIARQLAEQGLTGADLAAKTAEYMGERAGARTAGTREANVGMAVNEAQNFMPLALQASQNVNRTQFPTINSVLQAYEKGTGDENIVRLAVATNSLTNAYSRAITPSGIPTEGNQQRARDLLDKAWSQGQYSTAVDQLWKEMQAAKASPIQVRQEQQGRISGREPNAGATTPSLTTSPAAGQAGPQWQHDAVGPNGVHVYSNDGKSWFDISGKPYQPAGP